MCKIREKEEVISKQTKQKAVATHKDSTSLILSTQKYSCKGWSLPHLQMCEIMERHWDLLIQIQS